jgi:hypothetical protein
MSTLVTRAGKGSPLTHNEVDTNFTNLNTDKVEKTSAAITGGTIDNTVIGSTTPADATFTTLTATGQTSLGGATGSESVRILSPVATGSFVQIQSATDSFVEFRAAGTTSSNNSLGFISRGTGAIGFFTNNSTSTQQFRVAPTASAVNYVQVTGNVTTSRPVISAQGSDANIGLNLASKGNRSISLLTNSVTAFDVLAPASSVNFFTANGSITGITPSLVSSGTDTNIAALLQSKGTGAIDLAAGSSGVNISNGGTVTAITRTSNGSYTSMPTAVISAPTTAGGTQATLSPLMAGSTATVVAGGTGYTVGDTLTIVGATGTPSQLTVATLSGSAVATVTFSTSGSMSALPTNPVSVTGGTGSGATFTMTYSIAATQSSFTAGSGYVEQPTITFSGGGGSGAAAYATVGGDTAVKTLGTNLTFSTPAGPVLALADSTSGGAYIQLSNSSTGNTFARATGSATNIGFYWLSKGTGGHAFTSNNNSGTVQFNVSHTASAVNYVQVTGSVTGPSATTLPNITVQGSDTNTYLAIGAKGTGGYISFHGNASTSNQVFRIATLNAAGNSSYLQVNASASGGNGPTISAIGSDTNIDLNLTPKGTGNVRFGTYTGTILTTTGYVEIKDSGGTVRRLLVG